MASSKPGRNDPCPCGSGQKYKKCCQSRDEAAARTSTTRPAAAPSRGAFAAAARALRPSLQQALERLAQVEPSPADDPARPARELTPDEQWWETWWQQMKSTQGLDDKLTLARQAMAEGADPDDDSLLESFDRLMVALKQAGRHAECITLIDQLEQHFPLGFGHSRASFAHLRFESAIELPGADWVSEMRRLGAHAADLSDLLTGLPSRLAWEGRIEALRALIDTGWPEIRDSKKLMRWAVDEWAADGLGAALLWHLERDPALQADDPTLAADLAPYEVGAAPGSVGNFVRRWLRLLQSGPALPAEAAVLGRLGQDNDGPAFEQVFHLVAVVARRLREKRGWTRGQAWVLLRALAPLLHDCAGRVRDKKPAAGVAELLLPPTSLFLDRLEQRHEHMFASEPHAVVAVVLALPAWAGLVAERGWASEAQAHAWQQQGMGEAKARWSTVPELRQDALWQRMLAFVESEGRSREAWLLG